MPADRPQTTTSNILRIALSGVEARRARREGLARLMPAWSIRGALASAASIEPEKAAINFVRDAGASDQVETITYRALIGRVETAASLFRSVSDGPSVVTVLAPLLPEAVIATWGAAIAGVCNPVNPFLEVRHWLRRERSGQHPLRNEALWHPGRESSTLRPIDAQILCFPTPWSSKSSYRPGWYMQGDSRDSVCFTYMADDLP